MELKQHFSSIQGAAVGAAVNLPNFLIIKDSDWLMIVAVPCAASNRSCL